jgi:DNA polymerase III sliding clamp (beta) subunit (PCNA family)
METDLFKFKFTQRTINIRYPDFKTVFNKFNHDSILMVRQKDLKEILMRFVYFTSVSISGIALKELVSKIIKRFKR